MKTRGVPSTALVWSPGSNPGASNGSTCSAALASAHPKSQSMPCATRAGRVFRHARGDAAAAGDPTACGMSVQAPP